MKAAVLKEWVTTPRPSVLRDQVAAHTTPHEVTVRDSRLDGAVGVLALPESTLVFVRYGGEVHVEAPATADRIVATVPLGPMGAEFGNGARREASTETLVLSQDHNTVMHPDPLLGALVVASDPRQLRAHAHEVLGPGADLAHVEAGTLRNARPLEKACREMWTVVSTLPAETPAAVITSLAHALEDTLMSALVLAWSPLNSGTASRAQQVPDHRVHALLDWLRTNHGIEVTTTTMAQAVGLSIRQLQTCLQRELSTTPSGLLRDVRLMDAHHRLRAANPLTTTVASQAYASGFAHLGRFAAAYRARFGESPSTTLQRGRG